MKDDAPPWYAEGLRFTCTRCGRCCGGEPGYVWVDQAEHERLARHLSMDLAAFQRRYLRRVGRRFSLLERRDYRCIFWDPGAGCTVYEARPEQCRSYPFWPENLRDQAAWERVVEECPGSGTTDGRLYTPDEIDAKVGRS